MATDRDLHKALANGGYTAHRNGTYSKGNDTVQTDGSHWKKDSGNWTRHENGRSAG